MDAIAEILASGVFNRQQATALRQLLGLVGGGGGSGDVVGPASSTDNNVALFDGATGKLLKDGGPFTAAGIGAQPADTDLTAIAAISGVNGDLMYRTGGSWASLPIGASTQLLTVVAGAPAWAAPPSAALANWAEGLNSSAPNITITVATFTATNAATNVDAAILAKGTGALLLQIPDNTTTGGNKRGARAVDLQRSRTNANQVASGADSFVAGIDNRVNEIGAAAFGYANLSNGKYSFAIGSNGDARQIVNNFVLSSALGHQAPHLVLHATTTNATPTVLKSVAGSATATNQLGMNNGCAGMFRVLVIARQTAGSGTVGDCAGWDTSVLLKQISGTASIVGTPGVAQSYGDAGAAAWAIALTADATYDALAATVTGESGKTIRWTMFVFGPEA